MLNDNRRVKPLGHSNARIRELPVHATRPRRRVRHFPALEVVVSHRDGIERAGKGVRSVKLRRDIAREHAARCIGDRNPLDAQRRLLRVAHDARKPTCFKHSMHGVFTRKLNMVGMIPHIRLFQNREARQHVDGSSFDERPSPRKATTSPLFHIECPQ